MRDSKYKERTWYRRFSLAQEPEDSGEWPPDWHKSLAQSCRDPKNSNQVDPRTTRPSAVIPSPLSQQQPPNIQPYGPMAATYLLYFPISSLPFALCAMHA